MRRGTPEYRTFMGEMRQRADEQFRAALRRFTLEQLNHDWACNLGPHTRGLVASEFKQRGLSPPAPGSGRPQEEQL